MPDAFSRVPLCHARAAIAECMLGGEGSLARVGEVTLRAHQRSAASRLSRILSSHGGALLCDDVGLGKTYTALAVAAPFASLVVVAPAVLLPMWRTALAATQVEAHVISAESMGRAGGSQLRPALIIVDEAHNFRNVCTRRYASLAQMCARAPVLLLTATPLHNSRDDVAALVALFAGARAYSMTDADLGAVLVKRGAPERSDLQDLPLVEHAPARVLITDESVLDLILKLPAPVPPSDGGTATRLVVLGLVRQWVSSHAALAGALRRRIARSHALRASLDAGRYPTAAELSAWVYNGDSVQLAFAELLDPANTPLTALSQALLEHVRALSELLTHATHIVDDALAGFLAEIREDHPREKIVAFSCYAETVESLYRRTKRHGHVALLTARGAMIASGPVSRAEVIGQFSPAKDGDVRWTGAEGHSRIDTLIATDLLSEGVNLQEASVLVHLDLPWTQARLQQRVGRLARLGSRHSRVKVYTVNPPRRAEGVLRELETLARKAAFTGALFGEPGLTRSGRSIAGDRRSELKSAESARAILETWKPERASTCTDANTPVVGHARSPDIAAVGAWRVDGAPVLLAFTPSRRVSNESDLVEELLRRAAAVVDTCQNVSPRLVREVLEAAQSWYDRYTARAAVGASGSLGGRALGSSRAPARDPRRMLAHVADSTISAASFAQRAHSAALAARLRRAAGLPLPVAVEWSLQSLADSTDEAAVSTILDLVERGRPEGDRTGERGCRCMALVIIGDAEAG
ncbi:MAG: DEAD/DEAH box helicase [Gemmatimonadota bacterium]|nr:DEAD/DEAH box helicase [Gemmatimonadota bacterium]